MTKIAFIGAGNMASSMIAGLCRNHFAAEKIWVSNPSEAKRHSLANRWGIDETADNIAASKQADVIVLAVKPHFIAAVCQQLSQLDNLSKKCVVSVAAGITVAQIQKHLQQAVATIRAMPNTPSMVGQGMTGAFASPEVSASQRQVADQILTSFGQVLWVEQETQINQLLAVSGSGPAYFFRFMEAMQQQAINLGFTDKQARLLVQQTALGAAQMVCDSDDSIAQLRENVTSKGGTTQAALGVFEQGGLQQLVTNAMNAALNRAQEIADNN